MTLTRWRDNNYITDWLQFNDRVRSTDCGLLKRLDEFPNSVLVTGCQRSGTTMLSRILTQSNGMTNYWFGPDDELDAALILSGYVDHHSQGRYCFQTTYINRRHREYLGHTNGHRIIWVLRNPVSVVYSMLNNWPRCALNWLFEANGVSQLKGIDAWFYRLFGHRGIRSLRRACWSYTGKMSQLFDLSTELAPETIMIVNYDRLVAEKETVLPEIYQFIDLEYRDEYADRIHAKSLRKADRFSEREAGIIEAVCGPVYQRAMSLL